MKLSLRKANALQLLINEQISEPFSDSITVTKYDDLETAVKTGEDTLDKAIQRKFDLIEVLYTLRKKAGKTSTEVGIASLLTELAETEKLTQFFKQLASTKPSTLTTTQLKQVLKDATEQKDTYGRSKDAISFSLMTTKAVETYKGTLVTLRKQKQALSDKLLHLNVSTEIELDAKETDVLNKYELL